MLRYLLKHDRDGADRPDKEGWTPLSWAMNPPGYSENVVCLIQSGLVNINRQDSTGRTALSFSVTYGHIGIMQILMRDRHVKVNLADVDGRTPLSYAAANGSLEMVKLLLTNNETDVSAVDVKGNTPIIYATRNGHLEVVRLLEHSH
jgi:ankyrin repeat protein